jgi:hypothetical protein
LIALGDPVFEQVGVAGRALGEQRHRVLGVVVLAQDHHASPRMALADLLAGVDPFRLEMGRHADVTDDHVGVGRLGAGDEAVVVLGDADDTHIAVAAEHGAHAGADDRAVVGEKHGDLAHGPQCDRPGHAVRGRHPASPGDASHTMRNGLS